MSFEIDPYSEVNPPKSIIDSSIMSDVFLTLQSWREGWKSQRKCGFFFILFDKFLTFLHTFLQDFLLHLKFHWSL